MHMILLSTLSLGKMVRLRPGRSMRVLSKYILCLVKGLYILSFKDFFEKTSSLPFSKAFLRFTVYLTFVASEEINSSSFN